MSREGKPESEGSHRRVERLIAENAHEALRLRLRRLTSATLCRRMLTIKHPQLAEESLALKSEGIASAVRSALGYWEHQPAALNARILAHYYFVLQLSIAEQVANDDPSSTLEAIQKHTEQGHGLATIRSTDRQFPDSYYVCALKSGHFPAYCRATGIELGGSAFESRPRNWSKLKQEERSRLVSLADLLRRVPELRSVVHECLGAAPLSFHIVHSMKNMARKGLGWTPAEKEAVDPGETAETYVTFATGFGGGEGVTAEYLNALNLPITNITYEKDPVTNQMDLTGMHRHPGSELWFKSLPLYHAKNGTSLIVLLWEGIVDPFILHFMILYALSIVVRYLPSIWYEIEHGSLDHVKALLEQYIAVSDVVLPKYGIERIAGIDVDVIYPGSMQSPV
jgi:hypothetical protein